jgi:hypothetical protein
MTHEAAAAESAFPGRRSMKNVLARDKVVVTIRRRRAATMVALASLAFVLPVLRSSQPASASTGAPTSPSVICGNSGILAGPSVAPAGSVAVPAGNNTSLVAGGALDAANTTYYFATGTHTIGAQVIPGNNSTYIGAPGAIIDGGGTEEPMFNQTATGVTIKYLTIENFWQPSGQDVVNPNEASDWTIENDTIGPNNPKGQASYDGYGLGVGDNDTVQYNCITGNSEGGFNASGGPGKLLTGVVISNNEVSLNALGDYPDNCGCAAGGKIFWSTNAVITNNWVHDNYGTGIWADFNNAGANISGNYIASNWGEGIEYEASYNADISDNALVGNGWASDGAWPACTGSLCGGQNFANGNGPLTGSTDFPYGAILISDSGGNSLVSSNYKGTLLIEGNVLTDNFGGVVVYQDPQRFCGSPAQGNCSLQEANPIYYDNPTVSAYDGVTAGSTTVTSSAGFKNTQTGAVTSPTVGAMVYGRYIPTGDTVASVTSPNHITLTTAATGSGSGLEIDTGTPGGCGMYDLLGASPGSVTGSPAAKYYDNCIIAGAQGVAVSGNQFNLDSSTVTGCTAAVLCGVMATISYTPGMGDYDQWNPYGSTSYSPVMGTQLSESDHNVWTDNAYIWSGSAAWSFEVICQGGSGAVSQAAWQGAPYDQDSGSIFNATTTTTTQPPATTTTTVPSVTTTTTVPPTTTTTVPPTTTTTVPPTTTTTVPPTTTTTVPPTTTTTVPPTTTTTVPPTTTTTVPPTTTTTTVPPTTTTTVPPTTTTTVPPTTTTTVPPTTTTTVPPTTTTTVPPTTTTTVPPTTTTTVPPTTTTTVPPTTTTTVPPTTTTTVPPTTTTTVPPVQTDSVLSSSANPSAVGGAVIFTAAVGTGSPNVSGPTGTVAFTDNGKSISTCAAMVLTDSKTSCTVSFPAIGANTISASYSGGANYAPSTSGLLEETVSRGSTTRLVVSRNPSTVFQPVRFRAIIGAGSGGAGSPTGAVDFTRARTMHRARLVLLRRLWD